MRAHMCICVCMHGWMYIHTYTYKHTHVQSCIAVMCGMCATCILLWWFSQSSCRNLRSGVMHCSSGVLITLAPATTLMGCLSWVATDGLRRDRVPWSLVTAATILSCSCSRRGFCGCGYCKSLHNFLLSRCMYVTEQEKNPMQ